MAGSAASGNEARLHAFVPEGVWAMKVLGLSGSLRRGSFNTAALRAAQELAPAGMTIETGEIGDLPLYNDDLRAGGYPPPVERLRSQLAAADAVLFVTPEYNYSVPGVLKNTIDWASRPPNQPFDGKPAAIMGASPGLLGTARAQYHLRQMLVFLNVFPINKPEVFITQANTKFDEAGRLTDEATRDHIRKLLQSLADWTTRLQRSAAGGSAA
jgi:chromate reductase, NAD(P)H dehydrogenase (quinone)